MPFIVKPEQLVDNEAHHKGKHEEQKYLSCHKECIAVGVLEAENKGENYDTDNVVDDSGAEYGLSHTGLKLAHLLKYLHRYSHGGGSHYTSDEYRLKKLVRTKFREAVYAHIQQTSSHKGHEHSHAGYQEGNKARFFQFL